MSLALSFLGGMAKRGMQLNDEQREIDNRIELQKKLTEIETKARMRRESAARNAARDKLKQEAIATFQALGGGNIDQATLDYVTGLPVDIQNALIGKMQGPNAVDLGTLIKTQQITGKDGTEIPRMSLNMEQFNKQYRQQQDTLSAEIESLLLSDDPEDHASAMTLIKRSHLINPPKKKELELKESDLRSHRNGFLTQLNLTENVNGELQLKLMEINGKTEFNYLRDLSAAMNEEAEYYNSVAPYAAQANVKGWIGSGERIVDEHVNRVISNAKNENKVKVVNPNLYRNPGDENNSETIMRNIFKVFQDDPSQYTNSVVTVMEQGSSDEFGNRILLPKLTIVIGDVMNSEYYISDAYRGS